MMIWRMLTIVSMVLLAGCSGVCKAFPEWNEIGYQNDIEHDSSGTPETGIAKFAGQIAEIFVDPACLIGNKVGIVQGSPSP